MSVSDLVLFFNLHLIITVANDKSLENALLVFGNY